MPDTLPMTAFILIGASTLLLTLGVVPVMRRVALQTGTVDKPSARKIHASPVPLLGGAAIYVSFILALVFFGDRDYINEVVGIFVGATLMSFMGLVDDRWGLSSYVKLFGQLVAAGVLIYSGVRVQIFGAWLDVVLTLVWVVGITNAL
ncbi:MAG: undecaprenyl/decaprenyl-phosphate alpha-N-acetylglucosaminyl 1-phosphate transferase, partial [Candidatus Thermofonsia Clade 3 bacterium]